MAHNNLYLAGEPQEWEYLKPAPSGTKVSLLTIGGVQVVGIWEGKPGEFYLAWAPLLKRNKRLEQDLGLAKNNS
jgi:hypothetical protein